MRTVNLILVGVAAMAVCGCASGARNTDAEVQAVVLEETARQAAARTAEQTADSTTALEAGKDAAEQSPP